jgi:hypothetical protein
MVALYTTAPPNNPLGDSMYAEADRLEPAQWETLKALGAPEPDYHRVNQHALEQLVTSELAAIRNGRPMITQKGRRTVLEGSPRLWSSS